MKLPKATFEPAIPAFAKAPFTLLAAPPKPPLVELEKTTFTLEPKSEAESRVRDMEPPPPPPPPLLELPKAKTPPPPPPPPPMQIISKVCAPAGTLYVCDAPPAC